MVLKCQLLDEQMLADSITLNPLIFTLPKKINALIFDTTLMHSVERCFPKVMQNWGTQLFFTIKIQFLADYSLKGNKT